MRLYLHLNPRLNTDVLIFLTPVHHNTAQRGLLRAHCALRITLRTHGLHAATALAACITIANIYQTMLLFALFLLYCTTKIYYEVQKGNVESSLRTVFPEHSNATQRNATRQHCILEYKGMPLQPFTHATT